jgi:hypothetical protein
LLIDWFVKAVWVRRHKLKSLVNWKVDLRSRTEISFTWLIINKNALTHWHNERTDGEHDEIKVKHRKTKFNSKIKTCSKWRTYRQTVGIQRRSWGCGGRGVWGWLRIRRGRKGKWLGMMIDLLIAIVEHDYQFEISWRFR